MISDTNVKDMTDRELRAEQLKIWEREEKRQVVLCELVVRISETVRRIEEMLHKHKT